MFEQTDLRALDDAIAHSEFPALLLAVPSQLIVAASPAAAGMLSPQGDPVVGRSFDDFTVDEMPSALPLLMSGRLDGYETTRDLDRPDGAVPVTVWIRRADAGDPPRHVVAILTTPDLAAARLLPEPPAPDVPAVVGSTGADLLIDRISSDIEGLVGTPAEALLGRSLLSLVSPASASRLLWGLAQATTHGRGAPLHLDLHRADGGSVAVQLLIVPLHPPASCAFSILPNGIGGGTEMSRTEAYDLLAQLATGIDALGTARQMADISLENRRVLALLSARELDIVTRLLAGNRVPMIAKALFLSQSTVRNQLSSVFTKTGVHSQQELLDLLGKQAGVSPEA